MLLNKPVVTLNPLATLIAAVLLGSACYWLGASSANQHSETRVKSVSLSTGGDAETLTLKGPEGELLTLGGFPGGAFGIKLESPYTHSILGITKDTIVFTNNQSENEVKYYGGSGRQEAGFTIGNKSMELNFQTTDKLFRVHLVDGKKNYRLTWKDKQLLLETAIEPSEYKKLWSHTLK